MSKRAWPRCSEQDCTTAVREIVGDYRGPRQPEPDGRCSRHRIEDTTFVPTPNVPTFVEDQEPEIVLDESPVVVERIASLRDALRGDLLSSEVAGLIRDQLLEGLRASKSIYAVCPHCKHKHTVILPDLSTRISSTQKLVEEIEGKLAAKQEDAKSELQREADQLLKHRSGLSDDELSRLIVSLERELADDA